MKRSVKQIETEWLALRCQSGESDAFRQLVDMWQPQVLGIVSRLTQGNDEVADVAQEIWIKVARSIHRLDDPAAFPQWLFRIAKVSCADWVRKQQRRRRLERAVSEERSDKAPPGGSPDEPIGEVSEALAQLPEKQRLILRMFYLDDLSVAQISVALCIPEGTVKSRLFAARNSVRTLLERSES